MSDAPTVYLAGPVKEVEDSGAGWRERVRREHEDVLDFLNPLDKYDPTDDQQPIANEIVSTDLEMVARSDAVLVAYNGAPTWGTPMEVFFATEDVNIPVSLAWTADAELSPWAQVYADYVRPTLTTAVGALREGLLAETTPATFSPGIKPYDAEADIQAASDALNSDEASDEADASAGDAPSGDELARRLAEDVATLLTDSRDSHGDAVKNQEHIADAWEWYLGTEVDGVDVCRMMALLKMSRGVVGENDLDHDRDIAGYGAIAGACAVAAGDAEIDALQEHVGGDSK